ncbi:spaetzle domain-containing protein 3 [Augochlora pura]
MSLVNFTLPYQPATPTPFFYGGQTGGHSSVNNLRLNAVLPPAPAPNFNDREPFQNEPYIPPAGYQQQKQHQSTFNRQTNSNPYVEHSSFSSSQDTRYDNYNQDFRRTQPRQQQQQQQQQQMRPPPSSTQQQQRAQVDRDQSNQRTSRMPEEESYPERPNGYTRVSGEGGPGTKTSVHAVLDYDDDFDDYYDDDEQDIPKDAHVTPIQGPIFLKNGSVPVVPLYSYPQLNNGTFVQIPILWTALSVALGVELRGDLIRGVPCIKKFHQLFCPTAGNAYPIERIERFIDENKALMRRMYGDFEMSSGYGPPTREPGHRTRRRRKSREARKHDHPDGGPSLRDTLDPDVETGAGDSFFAHIRNTRNPRQSPGKNQNNESGRVDACESKVEIVTPYWASNSAGKIRAIVNTQHFEQAIHQEVCSKTQTNRCTGDCGCEQKYKWHRLLAYDPDNDCKGIFMDWFLFPSCCVCRCDPVANKFSTSNARN